MNTDDDEDGGLYYLALDLEHAGLAVADQVTWNANAGALMVPLDSAPDRQVAMAQQWLQLITVMSMTVGCYSKRHPMRYLHLRGPMPSGTAVIVSAGWPATSEQAELIYRDISRQDARRLLADLHGIEQAMTTHERKESHAAHRR